MWEIGGSMPSSMKVSVDEYYYCKCTSRDLLNVIRSGEAWLSSSCNER